MSLRTRLLAGMALVAVVLGVAAVIITRTTRAHLIDQVDAQLADAIAPERLLDRIGNRQPQGGPDQQGDRPRRSELYLAAVDADGDILVIDSPDLYQDDPPLPSLDGQEALRAAGSGEPFTVGSNDGSGSYRLVARRESRLDLVFVTGRPLDDVDSAVRRLISVEAVATASILGVLALVTYWVLRLGVRPVKQMTATATAIAGGDLSHRVPDVAVGTEAGELGTALNRMLGNIEEAFAERHRAEDRLRQFVADASHELRTPVTTIRGYAELYRAGGLDDRTELDEALRRTEQEAVRMGGLIDDLLHLARLDQGRPLERRPVALDRIVDDAVRDARAVDPARPIVASAEPAVTVVGDDARLRQVVGNIIGNAIVHTTPGTQVDVRLHRETPDRAVLEVSDRGPGMDGGVASRAFERFYRADPSRSRHRGGSGLGLAIVAATVRAHGGTVALRSTPDTGTTVRVELPVAGAAGVSPPAAT
jgi:two-component system OmpR family sensor kinase